jgi:hypothetical protein
MKRPPLTRRHLGDYEYTTKSGQVVRCAVFVNPEELGRQLVLKARATKSKRSTRCRGAILVESL